MLILNLYKSALIGHLYQIKKKKNSPTRHEWLVEAVFLSVLDYSDIIYRHASVSTLKLLGCFPLSTYIQLHPSLHFISEGGMGTFICTTRYALAHLFTNLKREHGIMHQRLIKQVSS